MVLATTGQTTFPIENRIDAYHAVESLRGFISEDKDIATEEGAETSSAFRLDQHPFLQQLALSHIACWCGEVKSTVCYVSWEPAH